ncbi:DUF5590 domain-containing protein [Lacticaseibacillus baoqingensis]|uniref:DUF5590 domain-containing protein n=1 Tax=Lacticaseibacillus baoqingensis TaxID=2486013 RepID=A0ABW4EB73_9LACO|nr:DUF5590 domain-containing protein [Lacticaseibacillus baoqingensis]
MRRAHRPTWHRTAWLVAGIVLIVIVLGIYHRGLSPMQQVRRDAITIAEKKAKIQTVDAFYWDRQRESYLTVAGTNTKKKPIFVLIRQKNGRVTILSQHAGISRQTAIAQATASYSPKKILSVGLSKRGKKFVWDVGYRTKSGKLGYVTYDFKSGDELFAVANL